MRAIYTRFTFSASKEEGYLFYEMEEITVAKSRFQRVCVFCGSSPGKRNSYQDAAVELGKELVARKVDLVYGGGSVGLMGLVAEAVHSGGGHVIGIIPRTLMRAEVLTGEQRFGEVKSVANMHQRKAEMARHSDAFIALPGPPFPSSPPPIVSSSCTQISSMAISRRLRDARGAARDHFLRSARHPPQARTSVGLLNVDGYYNSLLAFIDKAVEDGFIQPFQRHLFVSAPNANDLVQKLEVINPNSQCFPVPFRSLRSSLHFFQESVPIDDAVVSELSWEQEQMGLNSTLQVEIAR
ncbi:hypothetical protein ZIOFF_070198 [Zingiber officinale]|uniref:Cytokinin riboside 5'-monophosphate phosphoribohydrolase n=1 Tax=Zingiber officinale TaxID=94328 RepID=A0A8J5CWJ2_ZINOF|nr:hypothetical protein ZIOFF_070198 [Zingiber officinale]